MNRLALVPGALVLGGIAERLVLRQPPPALSTAFAQPLAVVTAWGSLGIAVWGTFAVTIAVAGIALWWSTRALGAVEPSRRQLVGVIAAAAASLAALYTWPVVFSSDVYTYALYGDLANHGLNPYAHVALPADAIARNAVAQWGATPPTCPYGPLFVRLAQFVVAATTGAGEGATIFVLRLCAGGAFLGCIVAVWEILRKQRSARRVAATVLFGLNPVALWSVAEGHNDALMLLPILVGVAAALRGRGFAGGLLCGLGFAFKAPAIVAGLALGIRRSVRGHAFAGLAVGLGCTALTALPFATGFGNQIAGHAAYAPQYSLQSLAAQLARLTPLPAVTADRLGWLAALAICAAVAADGLRRIAAGDAGRGLGRLAVAAWLAIPYPYPWYGLWFLPLAVTLGRGQGSALLGGTFASAVRYIPDMVGTLGPMLRF
ncbi:MAG: glycosyltransferase 87 family protein, partial [Vulcanimicrobiaceae bacterium]